MPVSEAADPISLEIFKQLFSSVAEEMGGCLERTAFSPNIKERRDYSCAVFDAGGLMVAQAAHLPVHLGSMPLSVKAAVEAVDMAPGDVVALNDPYHGGTHLPDITFVSPVYLGNKGRSANRSERNHYAKSGTAKSGTLSDYHEMNDTVRNRAVRGHSAERGPADGGQDRSRPDFYVACRAHHADVGGAFAGSMGAAREIYQEGLRIPPVKLAGQRGFHRDVLSLFLANVRTPEERRGDLAAQLACVRLGERRIKEMGRRYGALELKRQGKELQDYAERLMRHLISGIDDGDYEAGDCLDDDGVGSEPVPIKVVVSIRGDSAVIDFTGSAPQTPGNVNAVYAVTLSAVFYVFRCLAPREIPSNWGCMAPFRVVAPRGSVLNPVPPAAVGAGNVETSQRIVDVLLEALAGARGLAIPASSCGTMSNTAIGGRDSKGKPFSYYETIAGGAGAGPAGPGISAVHTHMTNTLNTPVEAIEAAYPLRVDRYEIRRGAGGGGRHSGGDGVRRDIRLLRDAQVSILSERRKFRPPGAAGGEPGAKGVNTLVRRGRSKRLPSKISFDGEAGDVVSIKTPGGGGHGKAGRRAVRRTDG
jgi:N-methylhydantoinase B